MRSSLNIDSMNEMIDEMIWNMMRCRIESKSEEREEMLRFSRIDGEGRSERDEREAEYVGWREEFVPKRLDR